MQSAEKLHASVQRFVGRRPSISEHLDMRAMGIRSIEASLAPPVRDGKFVNAACKHSTELESSLRAWQRDRSPTLWFGSLQALSANDSAFWRAIHRVSRSCAKPVCVQYRQEINSAVEEVLAPVFAHNPYDTRMTPV